MRKPVFTTLVLLAVLVGCDGNDEEPDPHIEAAEGHQITEDPDVLSPPIVGEPIYACTTRVVVQGFIPGAEIRILVDGTDSGGGVSTSPSGQAFNVSTAFTAGQQVTATQKFDGVTSAPSAAVTVRDHTADYPSGEPAPWIDPTPLYECGRAIGARGIIDGAALFADAEPSTGPGTYGPPQTVAQTNSSGSAQWLHVNPPFDLDARVTAHYEICSRRSPDSGPELVVHEPATIPAPTIDPIYEQSDVITVRSVVNGAFINVYANGTLVGSSATPGGSGQRIRVNPPAVAGDTYTATQELCSSSPSSGGVVVLPCSELPPAKIQQPEIGDTEVHVTDFVDGSRIRIYANGTEIADGGGPLIALTRPLAASDVLVVVQQLGTCVSQWVYVVEVACRLQDVLPAPISGPYAVGSLSYTSADITIGSDTVRMRATVRYPAQSAGAGTDPIDSPTALPLVVFLHGNHGTHRGPDDPADADTIPDDVCGGDLPEAPSYLGYNYVLDRLAQVGMIAVSIDGNSLNCKSGRYNERADLIIEHLEFWKGVNDGSIALSPDFRGRVNLDRVGIAGHSRGGEAVIRVPARLSDPAIHLRGILSLAPTNALGSSTDAAPLLMILPAADGDVSGNDGAEIYDHSISGNAGWFRSQMYVYGAIHNYFNREWLEDDAAWNEGFGTPPDLLSRAEHEALLSAWSRGFFELLLQDRTEYRAIFSGDAIFTGVRNDRVYVSYDAAGGRMVDNYQDPGADVTENSLGEPVNPTGTFATLTEASLRGGIHNFPHDTDGLQVEWDNPPVGEEPQLESRIPASEADATPFDALTLRVAQQSTTNLNDPATAMSFRVGLTYSVGGTTVRVDVPTTGAGVIPYPYQHPFGAKAVLSSVRFPLACFARPGGLPDDLTDVRAVHLSFDQTPSGSLAIDDLEFDL